MPFKVEVYGDQDLRYLLKDYTNGDYSICFSRDGVLPWATVQQLGDDVVRPALLRSPSSRMGVDAVYLHIGTNSLDWYMAQTDGK